MQGQNLRFVGDSLILDGFDRAYTLPFMDVIWEVNGIEHCDNLVIYSKDEEENVTAALDIESGENLWQAQYPGGVRKASCPVDTNISIYDISTQISILSDLFVTKPHPEQGSQNIYIEVNDFPNSRVLAIDRQTGTTQFINENTLLYITPNTSSSQTGFFRWAGGFRGMDFYAQPDFGMTRAHRTDDNELIWTSNQYALSTVLDGWDDVLIGVSGTSRDRAFVGVDIATGEMKWQREIKASSSVLNAFVGDYFVFNDEDNILILDPRTGQVETSIPLPFEPIPVPYGENYFIVWNVNSGVGLVELP